MVHSEKAGSAQIPTFVCGWEGDIFIAVHSEDSPSDKEWEKGLEVWRLAPSKQPKMLVLSQGGAPSTTQRARLNQATAHRDAIRVAIITSSRTVRLIGTAVGWFMTNTRIMAPAERQEAIEFLCSERDLQTRVARKLDELVTQLEHLRATGGT